MGRACTEENLEEASLISPHHRDEDDDEEEEALSLCDLPVNLSREVDEFRSRGEESSRNGEFHEVSLKPEEDFDFGFDFGFGSSLRVGSDAAGPAEMSTADELFFKGRILPLRHSVSLDAGFPGSTRYPTRFLSRSGSMDFRRTGSFASGASSRSSSCRSHYSSSTTATAGGGGGCPDRKIKNNFISYSHPSPQPQMIRRTSSLTARVSTSRNAKSSLWDFLRLGLVRGPEIELQDLKLRANATAATTTNAKLSVSRNSSCSSTSTSGNSGDKNKKTATESKTRKQRHGSVVSDRKRGFLFGDCRCSAAAVAVPLKNDDASGSSARATEEKKQRRKKKTATATATATATHTKEQKVAMARKRTFEWIKELSHASFVDHGRSLA